MSFESVMAQADTWITGAQALSALGVELARLEAGGEFPPEIRPALRSVMEAAGFDDLDEIPPPQRAVLLAFVRLHLHNAIDFLDDPTRGPGWAYTDPVILDGWGRASTMVPTLIGATLPELDDMSAFLDVGTGVGLLAVAAAARWPDATIVGIDRWEPSLTRARANVAGAGLDDRITLRNEDISALDDVDQYDCIWVPTFFLDERALESALPRILRATRPGGCVVLGHLATEDDPLSRALRTLQTTREGGFELESDRAVKLLEQAGFADARTAPKMGAVPLLLTVGRKPSS